jgi:hypothetical protein
MASIVANWKTPTYVAYRGPGVEIGVSSFATGAAAGV